MNWRARLRKAAISYIFQISQILGQPHLSYLITAPDIIDGLSFSHSLKPAGVVKNGSPTEKKNLFPFHGPVPASYFRLSLVANLNKTLTQRQTTVHKVCQRCPF